MEAHLFYMQGETVRFCLGLQASSWYHELGGYGGIGRRNVWEIATHVGSSPTTPTNVPIAQLVQSDWFTPNRSGVRIPLGTQYDVCKDI